MAGALTRQGLLIAEIQMRMEELVDWVPSWQEELLVVAALVGALLETRLCQPGLHLRPKRRRGSAVGPTSAESP